MHYIRTHFVGSLISSMYFLVLFYLYVMWIDGDFDFLSLPFIFLYVFPVYLLIANTITTLVRFLLKRVMNNYVPLLTIFIFILSILFNYIVAINSQVGFDLSGQEYTHFVVFCCIAAFPSVLGVEYSDR